MYCETPGLRCLLLQKRLIVDLELFNDFLESTHINANVEHSTSHHVVSTDQCKTYLHESTEKEIHLCSQCKLVEKVPNRYDQKATILQQTTTRSRTNLTWRPSNFLQVDFSHQLDNPASITNNKKHKPNHTSCLRTHFSDRAFSRTCNARSTRKPLSRMYVATANPGLPMAKQMD